MEKRKALGRGLQALIPDINSDTDVLMPEVSTEGIVSLDVDDVKPGRYQPRSDFNPQRLQELVASIKEKGVIQPILVRKTDLGYELIAGERRLRAVKQLQIPKIPAIIKDVDDSSAMELALIENIQREDLNPIEEARAYKRLCDEFEFTQEKIAQAVGRDRSSVTNTLRLLNLPTKIQQHILDDAISMGHARALLSISDPHRQMRICERIINKGLSVREAEQLVRPQTGTSQGKRLAISLDADTRAVEEQLQQVLGTRVRIIHGKKRGRLIIEYLSPADLERIIGIIRR